MCSMKRFLTRMLCPIIYGTIFNSIFCAHSDAFDDVMTDRAMINLAYSQDSFRNIGALYKIYAYPCCAPRRVKTASVVYIGGKTCFTNAHCFEVGALDLDHHFLTGYQVSFELSMGVHTFFVVLKHVVHPNYQASQYNDIAMICLNKIVNVLSGIKPIYSFGKNEYYTVDLAHNQLTCVGYGHSGDDDSLFITNDSSRRALQTELFYAQKPNSLEEIVRVSMPNKSVCSLPYKKKVYAVFESDFVHTEEVKTVSRNRFPNESLMRQGMSGGAMLYNGDFVGINAIMSYELVSSYDETRQNILSYTNMCMNGFLWPFCRLRTSFPFEGSVTYGVPLGMYEEWIEGHRARFDAAIDPQSSRVAPQSEVITAEERGFDIELGVSHDDGAWVEAPGSLNTPTFVVKHDKTA